MSIQAGENPWLIAMKLRCFLGESYLKERGEFPRYNAHLYGETIRMRIAELLDKQPIAKSAAFNEAVKRISDIGIQQVLKEVYQRDLAIALLGCEKEVAQKFWNSMSNRLATMIMEDMEIMKNVRENDILEVQGRMLEIINRL